MCAHCHIIAQKPLCNRVEDVMTCQGHGVCPVTYCTPVVFLNAGTAFTTTKATGYTRHKSKAHVKNLDQSSNTIFTRCKWNTRGVALVSVRVSPLPVSSGGDNWRCVHGGVRAASSERQASRPRGC